LDISIKGNNMTFQKRPISIRWMMGRREVSLALACLGAVGAFRAFSPYFLTAENLTPLLLNSVVLGPVAGTCLGMVSGFMIVVGKVPPIIATLGLFGVYRAAIFLLLGGSWISGLPNTLAPLVNSAILGIPVVAVYVLVFYFVGWLILRWFPLGTAVLAVGGNEHAAQLAGVAVGRSKFFVYATTGFLVGFAALLYVARYRNVETSTGGTVALDAIVAAVLGGSSVLGGRANLAGTMMGVVLVRVLQNGFVLAGVPSLWEQVITGSLLLLVLILDAMIERSVRLQPAL
jgi:ribose/xylose/arabinose/galactoside ABC-type transport system permease subunit